MRLFLNRANRVVERQRFFQTGPLFVWQKTGRDRAVNVVYGALLTAGVIGSTAGLVTMARGK